VGRKPHFSITYLLAIY